MDGQGRGRVRLLFLRRLHPVRLCVDAGTATATEVSRPIAGGSSAISSERVDVVRQVGLEML